MNTIQLSEKEIRRRVLSTERESTGRRAYINIVLAVVGVVFLFPIAWMIILSFKSQAQITSMPPDLFSGFTLENYQSVLNINVTYRNAANASLMQAKSTDFLQGLLNTAIVAFFSVGISALVGIPAAYGLSRYKNALKEQLAFISSASDSFPSCWSSSPCTSSTRRSGCTAPTSASSGHRPSFPFLSSSGSRGPTWTTYRRKSRKRRSWTVTRAATSFSASFFPWPSGDRRIPDHLLHRRMEQFHIRFRPRNDPIAARDGKDPELLRYH